MTAPGCLSGNGRGTPVEGTYTFRCRGLNQALLPDVGEEKAGADGVVPFSRGDLTDGDPATGVGWKGRSVGEGGVDIVVDLDGRYFVDRVVLRQRAQERGAEPPSRAESVLPGGQGGEVVDYVEPSGLSCVEVYTAGEKEGPYAIAGRIGEKGSTSLGQAVLSIDVGVEARELVVRAISFQRDIFLAELEIWGASPDEPRVFPVPRKMAFSPGEQPFRPGKESRIIVGREASEETRFGATLFAEKFEEDFGVTLPVVSEGEVRDVAGCIVLGKPGECGFLDGLPPELRPEGYVLDVRSDAARLLAPDRRGLIYGAETLLQLLKRDGANAAAEVCRIEDDPRMAFRGIHMYLPAREHIPFAKRLVRYLLAPMKMNTIFLELAGGMQFERRPEINRTWEENNRKAAEGKGPSVPHGGVCGGGWITKAEIKDFLDYTRSYGIEVIPEIQSLSHVQYLTMTYPEIAEQQEEGKFPDAYCPLHPDSHKIVFDLIDEVADLFQPLRYIHMGHDEVYTMGVCERCKGKTRAELYAYDVNRIYDYLKSKGLGMMVWADMLQAFRYYSGPEAIDRIPKDIVMLEFVWYFRTGEDTENILLENGFKVIFGNYYSSHFTRFSSRSRRENVIGAEVSVWGGTNEVDMGRLGKLYDFMYAANTTWSDCHQDELRWTLDRKISGMLPAIRSRLHGAPLAPRTRTGICLDLSGSFTASLRDRTGERGGYDLTGLPGGDAVLKGVPFRVGDGVVLVEGTSVRRSCYPSEVRVPVGLKAAGLMFLHTCSSMGTVRAPIGQYEVEFADGSTETLRVDYGYHVAEWDRRHGAPLSNTAHRHAGYVATYPVDPLWQGKTPVGQDVTLYGLEWSNPQPEKEIRSLRLTASESAADASLILVAATALIV